MAEEENLSSEVESAENTMLKEAVESLHTGDRVRARDLLTRLLKADQNNATYWLWLSAAVDNQKERLYCLQTALKLDPENVSAKRGLILLGSLPPDDSTPPFPLRKREWEEKLIVEEEKKPKGLKAAWTNPLARAFIILIIGLVVLGLVSLGFLLPRTAARHPTLTPVPFSTFTHTPTSWITSSPVFRTAAPTFVGPTPLWMLLPATYTPTPLYVATEHPAVSRDAFRSAFNSFKKGDYQTAIFQFQQVLTYEPNAADVYYYIGESYFAMRDYNAAREAYRKSVEVNPNFAPGYLGQARTIRAINPKTDVQSYLNEALSLDPQYEAAYIERAIYYLAQNKTDEALADLNSALALKPNDPLAYLYLAQAQLKLGENAEALASAQKANQLDMTLLPVYLVLGQAYSANDRLAEAISPLHTYTQFVLNDVEAFVLLGAAYNATGDYPAAIRVLNRAIGLNKKNSQAYSERGYAYLMQDDGEKAEADYRLALAYDPNNFDAHLGLGRSFMLQGYYGDAYLQFDDNTTKRLADTDAEKAQLYYWTATALEKLNEKTAAKRFWRDLLALPEEVVPPEWRAEAETYLNGTPTPPPPTTTATKKP